jgi:phenylacetate-CoA ligase
MLIIKGVNIYPMQIEKVLMDISGIGNNYLIEIDNVNFLDTIKIKVEVVQEIFHGHVRELENLKSRIVDELKNEILIRPQVVLVEPNTLPKSEGKAVRVVDRRGDR